MPELFGEDLTFEGFSPLLWAKLEKHPENSQLRGWGFTYNEVSKKDLENTPRSIDWAPTALTIEQFVIINQLCDGAIIDTSQQDFISFLTVAKQSVDEFISNIVATGLVARNREKLELTTTECKCAILPDGRYIAAEDNTGRLTRWVEKYMQDMDESMSTKPRSAFSSSDI